MTGDEGLEEENSIGREFGNEPELPRMRRSKWLKELASLDKLIDLKINLLGITRTIDFRGYLYNIGSADIAENEKDPHIRQEAYYEEADRMFGHRSKSASLKPDESKLTYIDKIVTRGPDIAVTTQPYSEVLGVSLGEKGQSIVPENLDGYTINLGLDGISFPGFNMSKDYNLTTGFHIRTADRALAREIHDAVVAKLQDNTSADEVMKWLVNESRYAKMERSTYSEEYKPSKHPHESDLIESFDKYYNAGQK